MEKSNFTPILWRTQLLDHGFPKTVFRISKRKLRLLLILLRGRAGEIFHRMRSELIRVAPIGKMQWDVLGNLGITGELGKAILTNLSCAIQPVPSAGILRRAFRRILRYSTSAQRSSSVK